MAIAGASSAIEPSSGRDGGATMPRTPIGSTMATATARSGGLCTAPSYLSAQPAKAKRRSTDWATSSAPSLPVCALMRAANSSRAVVEVLGEEVEDLRAVVGGGRAPAERGAGGFDGVADVLAVAVADFADERRRRGRGPGASSRCRGGPACRRCTSWRCGRCRRSAPSSGLARLSPRAWRRGCGLQLLLPGRLQVGAHAFLAAFAAEAGFLVAAEADARRRSCWCR